MRDFDWDQFEERAAILEYGYGMSRFEAETVAAGFQGAARWQALKIVKENIDENGRGPVGADGHHADAMGGGRDADPLPRVQRQSQEEARPLPERQPEDGWDRGALLALWKGNGGAL